MKSFETLEPRRLLSAGDLDPAFGNGGLVVDSKTAGLQVGDINVLPGDKILVAGSLFRGHTSDRNYLLRRYNDDGTLDLSFGGLGSVTGRFTNNSTTIIAIEPGLNGSIVALARDDNGKTNQGILARFNSDGSLDTSFNAGGFVDVDDASEKIAVQSDGDVLVAAATSVTRYNADGTLDATFGSGGTALNLVGSFIGAVIVQPDGKILVGGDGTKESPGFALDRLNANGTLDNSFGTNGKVLTNVNGNGPNILKLVRGLAVLSDGEIIAGGEGVTAPTGGATTDAVAQYQSNGTLDTSFGDNGIRFVDQSSSAEGVIVDGSGQIYLTTFAGGVTRLASDGTVDQTFGNVFGGVGSGAGLLSSGRLVLGGETGEMPGLVLIGRLTVNNGVPSPITLAGRRVSVNGTSGNDVIHAEDFSIVSADLNGFGRSFDAADVDVISVSGGDGDDEISMGDVHNHPVEVSGGDGSDKITGGDKNDTLSGNAGRDFIDGGLGADLISGNGGKDQLRGQGGADHLYGGAQNDYLEGDGGNDRLDGGSGSDVMHGNGGNDRFISNDGEIDTLFGDGGTDTATADAQDLKTSIEILI